MFEREEKKNIVYFSMFARALLLLIWATNGVYGVILNSIIAIGSGIKIESGLLKYS